MNKKSKFIIAGIGGLLTAVLLVLILFVDVAPIGPEGTNVGLSHLNQAAFDFFGVNMLWYNITDIFRFVSIFIAALFAVVGLIQWIKRKNMLKVDGEILLLGCLYLVVIGLYVMFEFVIVNYRPIIMPDSLVPESSFPSSHTMLICTVMGSTMMLVDKYISSKTLCRALKIICPIIVVITIVGRIISGVHWFTDVVGAILISTTLLSLYSGMKEGIDETISSIFNLK